MKLEIPPQANSKPITTRFWLMTEIEAIFNKDGSFEQFRVLRSFKKMQNEDKKAKEEPEQKQTKITIGEDIYE